MSTDEFSKPGVMLSCELEPPELIRLAQLAESVGYGELWYTDQRFWRDCFAGLALVAQHTKNIRIGPGVSDPFTRHPALIAMAIATVDELSNGRAQLGIGAGGSGIAEMRIPKEKPVRALREAIEIIHLMLSGETADYRGEAFQLVGGRLGFKPVRAKIPVYVATHSPQTLKLSGRLADGVILGNMARPEAIEHATASIQAGEREAGRVPGTVAIDLRLEAVISENRDAAFSVLRRRMAHRLITSYPNWAFLGEHQLLLDPGIATAAEARNRDAVERLLKDEDVRATALVGNPAEATDQLTSLLTPNVGRVTIRPYGFESQPQDVTVRLFAEEVWPQTVERRNRVAAPT